MTDSKPRNYVHAEVLGGGQRRRRWTPEEKLRMVEETFLPGNSVSRVARMHGVAPNQLFGWRRQAASGALTATRAGGERYVDPQMWRAETPLHEGSWWPAWQQWLAQRSAGRVAPPAMSGMHSAYTPLGDAPGAYVAMK